METNATQLHDLEVTARAVIETLRTLPKYTNLQIAVFGGMAVMAYSLNPRRTKDVNFVVDATNTTICNEIQPDLVKHCNPQGSFYYVHSASFLDRSLYHKHTNAEGEEIRFRVDFWPNPPSPNVWCATQRISDIPAGEVPYISREDLVVIKIDLCQRTARNHKAQLDALDAQNVLSAIDRPLCLTEERQKAVRQAIKYCTGELPDMELSWWAHQLGMPDLGNEEQPRAEGDGEALRGSEDAAGHSGAGHAREYGYRQFLIFGVVVFEIREGGRAEAGTP